MSDKPSRAAPLWQRISRRTARPQHSAPSTQHTLAVRQRGEGPPLVLLHGLASSGRYWGDMLPLAAERRVIAPDLLGFGRSPKPRRGEYTPAEHLAALRPTLRRRLQGSFDLLGHSLGSLIALHYAAAYPEDVRRLVLVSLPVVGDCAWGHGLDGQMHPWHRFSVHSPGGDLIFGIGMRLAAPVWARFGPRFRRDVPAGAVRDALAGTWSSYWRSLEAVVYGTDVTALLEKLHPPVTIIHGPDDPVTPIGPVRALVAAHPALRLVEIAGAGHNPYFTQPAAMVRAIRAALDDVDDASQGATPSGERHATDA